jgi:sodium-dependent dicarboxylate transporter 2/3/5
LTWGGAAGSIPRVMPENTRPPSAPWRGWGLALGAVVFAVLALVPSGLHQVEGHGHRPAYAAAAAALMAAWWFTEALPIAWTACLPLLLYPALGVFGTGLGGDLWRSASPFADAYIFLFMGGMTIGAGMEESGLHRRVALHIMAAIGTDPKRLLLGVLVATASVSLWISNTATAVMMVPIGMALIAQLEAESGRRRLGSFGAAAMLAVAYGSNVGGIGTKLGTATNSIFLGFVADKLGAEIGFLDYLVAALPFVVLFVPLAWAVLWQLARGETFPAAVGRDVIRGELARMGAPSRGERRVAAVFAAAALLWIFGDLLRPLLAPHVPVFWEGFRFQAKHYEAWVAMAGGLGLVALRNVSIAGLRRVPWSALVLLGGSYAMAAGIEGSGLSTWIGRQIAGFGGLPLFWQVGIASLATVALSAVASNTATVSVLLNVLPRRLPVLWATSLAASCDFMLPAGTPPNAIVFGSGYIRLPVMMRTGFLLDVAAVLLVWLYTFLYVRWFYP